MTEPKQPEKHPIEHILDDTIATLAKNGSFDKDSIIKLKSVLEQRKLDNPDIVLQALRPKE